MTVRIQSSDLLELQQWMGSEPTVPNGDWFKRFKTGTLAGHGEEVWRTGIAPVPLD